jgi:hypothetical protein
MAARLARQLADWQRNIGAPIPAANPQFDAAAERQAIAAKAEGRRRK